MSIEGLEGLDKLLRTDAGLRTRLGEARDRDELVRRMLETAAERGLAVTREELESRLVDAGPTADGLRDEALEAVSGGSGEFPTETVSFSYGRVRWTY
jgi:hypothetical protein